MFVYSHTIIRVLSFSDDSGRDFRITCKVILCAFVHYGYSSPYSSPIVRPYQPALCTLRLQGSCAQPLFHMQPFTSILVQSLLNMRSYAHRFARLHTHTVHPARSRKLSVCQRSCARFLRVRCLHAARCVPIACRRSRCATMHERLRFGQRVGGQARPPYVCALFRLFRLWRNLYHACDLVHCGT